MRAVGLKFKEELLIMIGSIMITMVERMITKTYQVKNCTSRQKIVNGMVMLLVIIEECFQFYSIFQNEQIVLFQSKLID
jgi:hypothetical protein